MIIITFGLPVFKEDLHKVPSHIKASPLIQFFDADEYAVVAIRSATKQFDGDVNMFEGLSVPINGEVNLLIQAAKALAAGDEPSYILINRTPRESTDGTDEGGKESAAALDGDPNDQGADRKGPVPGSKDRSGKKAVVA